jgi:hypothetical protein
VLVVPTNEELEIARETRAAATPLLDQQASSAG